MVGLAHESMAAGALGISSSQAHTHNDGDGQPVPSRWAARPELEALFGAARDHPGTTVELIVPGCINGFSEEEVELMGTLSLLADRPVNWNVLAVSAGNPDGATRQLEASTAAAARGASVVALTLPHTMQIRLSFLTGTVLDGLPGWREILALPVPERMTALSDPETRRRMDSTAHSKEAGILAASGQLEDPAHRRDLRPGERRLRRPHRRRRGRRAGPGALRRPLGRGGGRRAAYRAAAADPGDGRRLGPAGQDLARPPNGGGRLRRRRPSRHDVRCRVLDGHARRGRAQAQAPVLGGGHPPAHRRPRPSLRPPPSRPPGRGMAGRPRA